MPGMYSKGDYDLAGFCVGIAEKSKVIDGSKVCAGDVLIGLPSSGPHSNGYSLIRKVLEVSKADLSQDFHGQTLAKALLTPTKIYIKPLLALLKTVDVKALAHITGGGFTENIPRVLPEYTQAVLNAETIKFPAIFEWIQDNGNISDAEMYRTFNCGTGMVLCVSKGDAQSVIQTLSELDEEAYIIGTIKEQSEQAPSTIIV
jgi:phosphoribosylformylglycinamidine cyclo-ligase